MNEPADAALLPEMRNSFEAQKSFSKMNVQEILQRTENDIYLSENGPNFIEPLTNPLKDIKAAIKGFDEKNWEAQFNASNTMRRALKYHQNEITTSMLKASIEKLLLTSDSLRS